MVSPFQSILFSSFIFLSLAYAQGSFRPDALVLPVRKDASTLQYVTNINQRTPLVAESLVLDLGGQFLWVDCEKNYVSSTLSTTRCGSAQCSLAKSNACGGSPPTICIVSPENSITRTATVGELSEDVVSVQSTDGSYPGQAVTVPKFLFSCAPSSLSEGLAGGVVGMAGLGRSKAALPSQFASTFSFKRKFAICLSSSSSSNGALFFGDGPYNFLPNVDPSRFLTYTPLLNNPSTSASAEYLIGVKSIKVNHKVVPMDTSLLSINSQGIGGTKISTVNPYTVMESSIYKTFTEAFISEAAKMNITRVAPVAPFDVCFSTSNVLSTRIGPAVPFIDLVLQRKTVVWTMTGLNSMVDVGNDVLCLGFVDGGSNPTASIVIGGHQLEDKLLQFDLANSRLGFSPTLYAFRTTCANFNFTSSP